MPDADCQMPAIYIKILLLLENCFETERIQYAASRNHSNFLLL